MKEKILLFAMGLTILLISCNKRGLDLVNPNQLTTASFWKTEDDALKATIACYSGLTEEGIWKRWCDINFISRSDEGNSFSPWGDFSNYSKFVLPNYNFDPTGNAWQDHYRTIFRTNQVLAYIPNITMNETLKKRSLAEAKFIRALLYFQLVTLYGSVPIVTAPSVTTDRPKYSTGEEDYTLIIKDLMEAKPDLPVSYDNDNVGRITKGAVSALLGKVYMQKRNWALAAPQLLEVINGPYDLMADFMDNFRIATENNKESVFEIQFSDIFNGPFWEHDSPNSSKGSRRAIYFSPRHVGGYSDATATKWTLNQFLLEKTIDGKTDPRLNATFIYNKPADVDGTRKWWGFTYAELAESSADQYWFRKYSNDETSTQVTENSGNNIRLIRLSDILLLYAECLNELDQTGTAYQYIDRVRQRSNLAKLSDAKPGLTKMQMKAQIEHERIVELAAEDWRWHDLLRWDKLTTQSGLDELKSHDPEFNLFVLGRDNLLPIPQYELDINPNLKQNPKF